MANNGKINATGNQCLTPEKFAEQTNYSARTIRGMCQTGRIKAKKVGGGRKWLIPISELEGFKETLPPLASRDKPPPKYEETPPTGYQETRHKQQMRESATKLCKLVCLPYFTYEPVWEIHLTKYNPTIIIPLEPAGISGATTPIISFGGSDLEDTKVIIPTDQDTEVKRWFPGHHLWIALRNHLESGRFGGDTIKALEEQWKPLLGKYIVLCQKLWSHILGNFEDKEKLKKAAKLSDDEFKAIEEDIRPIGEKFRSTLGFTCHFPRTIYRAAIEFAHRLSPSVLPYHQQKEGDLYLLQYYACVIAICDEQKIGKLKVFEKIHKELKAKYLNFDELEDLPQVKKLSETLKDLGKTSQEIKINLQKFIDMERLPGHCELCSE